jgi:hypothetical protein
MRYAVLKTVTIVVGFEENLQPITEQKKFVENVVAWDGISPWSPGSEFELMPIADGVQAEIGDVCIQQEDTSYVFQKP